MKDSIVHVAAGAAASGTFLTQSGGNSDLLKIAVAGLISLITQIALKWLSNKKSRTDNTASGVDVNP